MEYAGMPDSWVDYYKQGFEAVNEKYKLGVSQPDIIKSVEALKEFNPRVNYREEEYSPESIFSKVLKHWDYKMPVADCINTFFKGLNLETIIYPDTIPSLLKLKDMEYKVATLTDLPTAMPDELFKKHISSLLQYFDLYISSQSCGFRKPNSKGLQQISEYYHVPMTELIFVGDEEKDRKTAVNAGCQFVLINRKEKVSDGICNLNELVTLMESRNQENVKMNIAVFASHGGSDLQAIMDGCSTGRINARVAVVISNNGNSTALQRADRENIPSYHLSARKFGSEETLAKEILDVLSKYKIDMIFLAGYMRLLHVSILQKYHNRIFNIHPALLPKFGGKGMYGMNVHHAVIQAHESETGITIHRVNAEYDSGEIVAQTKVPVRADDTAEVLAARVLEREHEFLVEVISDIVNGQIALG